MSKLVVFPTLYKLASTGAIQEWAIRVEDNVIITTHGQQHGKSQTIKDAITYGKNVGRANETTPHEQAEFEARAKFQKKIDSGYTEDLTAAKAGVREECAAPKLLLAKNWDESIDPTGFLMSEKLDGVRAMWNGEEFVSRQGNVFPAPAYFSEGLPPGIALDGEIWLGRGKFQDTIRIVKKAGEDRGWSKLKYLVFDAPVSGGVFTKRLDIAKKAIANAKYAELVPHPECTSMKHLLTELVKVQKLGGEGLMLRKADSAYEGKRSSTLLKVKTMLDAEAKVVAHESGRGKHQGRLGALVCVDLKTKVKFNVGSGLTDADRNDPPKIGSIITYQYQELTEDNCPRFPVFLAVRDYE